MLTVEKIGGTSMIHFSDVLNNIMLKKRSKDGYYNRMFVVSAYQNVTNGLLEHKKTGAPGIYTKFVNHQNYIQALNDLLFQLSQINQQFVSLGLNLKAANKYIKLRIQKTQNYLDSMMDVLTSGYVEKQSILLAARELLASIGEAHSAFNTTNILNNHDLNATFIDLSGFHDLEYLTIDQRIDKELAEIDYTKTIPIITGYTKGTEGLMREFDRGYSEVTFSKIALKFKADEAIIHKEYHLSSADPNIVGIEHCLPVCFTNYDVADQLADIGLEAIHPKAAKPLELAKINLRIKNTFEPDHPGTLITKDYLGPNSKVEIIAGAKNVFVIEVHDPSMVGEVGFDMRLMEIFVKHNISYIAKTTNANSISILIWDHPRNQKLVRDLRKQYPVITAKEVAVVSIIGSNIATIGMIAKAATALAENQINIECTSQSLRQVNAQFFVPRKDYAKAIIALNAAFFRD
jgi:aspartate kinase